MCGRKTSGDSYKELYSYIRKLARSCCRMARARDRSTRGNSSSIQYHLPALRGMRSVNGQIGQQGPEPRDEQDRGGGVARAGLAGGAPDLVLSVSAHPHFPLGWPRVPALRWSSLPPVGLIVDVTAHPFRWLLLSAGVAAIIGAVGESLAAVQALWLGPGAHCGRRCGDHVWHRVWLQPAGMPSVTVAIRGTESHHRQGGHQSV